MIDTDRMSSRTTRFFNLCEYYTSLDCKGFCGLVACLWYTLKSSDMIYLKQKSLHYFAKTSM